MLSFVPLKICRTLNDGLVGSHFSQDCCYAFFKSRHTCHLKTFASTSIQTVKVKRNRVPTNFEKNKESSEIDKVGVDSGTARVVLKKGKSFLFLNGSPIVYSGAIDRVVGRPQPKTGDSVIVQDHNENTIGWGLFNSVSMFRVRLMETEAEAKRNNSCTLNLPELINLRIFQALKLRNALGLPAGNTDVFRMVNSEGDRLSGLVVDVLGPTRAVISSSAAWTEIRKEEISTAITRALGADVALTWRPSTEMLKEEGWTADSTELEEAPPEVEEFVQVKENGIKYLASPSGQKTGFYADQRESRKFLGSISRGKRVLDLCCYSGGFALSAALGGASEVIGVDSSLAAIQLANQNAVLNGLDSSSCHFIHADINNYMKEALTKGESWDIIVLDPPKLAPNRKVLEKASIRYKKLNSLAIRLVTPGGLLMTCSCSGAVAQSGVFPSILQQAAASAGREVRILRSAGAAPDHPLDLGFPEGKYLSNVLLQVI